MKYSIERTAWFKRDFKLAEKQGLNIKELEDVVIMLANGEVPPERTIRSNPAAVFRDIRTVDPSTLVDVTTILYYRFNDNGHF